MLGLKNERKNIVNNQNFNYSSIRIGVQVINIIKEQTINSIKIFMFYWFALTTMGFLFSVFFLLKQQN